MEVLIKWNNRNFKNEVTILEKYSCVICGLIS